MNPREMLSRFGLGVACAALGDYEDSVHFFKSALRIESADALTLCSLGAMYHRQGKLEDAVDKFRCVVGCARDHARVEIPARRVPCHV